VSGNTLNAAVWGGADVLVGPITATIPTTNAAFPMNRTATVGTTNSSPTVTGATFVTADIGQSITGTGIPASTTITAVTPGVSATISANATATGSPTATIGATTGWKYAGLLDGGQGFEDSVDVDETQHSAWGYGTIFTTYKDQVTTKTFTALEENATTMGLLHDVTSMTFDDDLGTYVGTLKVRDHTTQLRIAFVTTSGTKTKRLISKSYATVKPTSAGTDSEESLGSKGFTATIYPNGSNELWYTYKGAA
jgi:hypothetical protein